MKDFMHIDGLMTDLPFRVEDIRHTLPEDPSGQATITDETGGEVTVKQYRKNALAVPLSAGEKVLETIYYLVQDIAVYNQSRPYEISDPLARIASALRYAAGEPCDIERKGLQWYVDQAASDFEVCYGLTVEDVAEVAADLTRYALTPDCRHAEGVLRFIECLQKWTKNRRDAHSKERRMVDPQACPSQSMTDTELETYNRLVTERDELRQERKTIIEASVGRMEAENLDFSDPASTPWSGITEKMLAKIEEIEVMEENARMRAWRQSATAERPPTHLVDGVRVETTEGIEIAVDPDAFECPVDLRTPGGKIIVTVRDGGNWGRPGPAFGADLLETIVTRLGWSAERIADSTLIVNDRQVSVRVARTTYHGKPKKRCFEFYLASPPEGYDNPDYIVLICLTGNRPRFFMVPFAETIALAKITITVPKRGTYKGKWTPYFDRWDLLQPSGLGEEV